MRKFLALSVCLFFVWGSARADLISHWTFDEHLEDDGVAGNDGTFYDGFDLIGEPTWVPDHDEENEDGFAIEFDGIDDIVVMQTVPDDPLTRKPEFSISMWVKGDGTLDNVDDRVFSESNIGNVGNPLFNLGTHNQGADGTLDLYVRAGATRINHGHSTGIAFDGEWHHFAYVDVEGTVQVYIDGALDAGNFNYARPAPDESPLDTITFGAIRRAMDCCWFTGAIDDVRTYDHALTQEEVAALFDPDRECPEEGDTHCAGLDLDVGPEGDIAGEYTFDASGSDDSGDDVLYLFSADNGVDPVLTAGPQPENITTFFLGAGTWTISVTLDDDPLCPDVADDATCTLEVEVLETAPQLLGHWTMEGHLEDETGNGNDGTMQTLLEPLFTDGQCEESVQLDGMDMVVVDQALGLPLYNHEAFSIAMWVKGDYLEQLGTDRRVWSAASTTNNNPLFNIGTTNNGIGPAVDIYIRGGGTTFGHVHSTLPAFDGTWHHITWVDDNGDAALYVDGILDPTSFAYTRPVMTLDTTSIGGILRGAPDAQNPSHQFLGEIDDVRVYNYILSEEEITGLIADCVVCPEEGDSHCDDIEVTTPFDGEVVGQWTFTSLDATDDSIGDDDDSAPPIILEDPDVVEGGGCDCASSLAGSRAPASLLLVVLFGQAYFSRRRSRKAA